MPSPDSRYIVKWNRPNSVLREHAHELRLTIYREHAHVSILQDAHVSLLRCKNLKCGQNRVQTSVPENINPALTDWPRRLMMIKANLQEYSQKESNRKPAHVLKRQAAQVFKRESAHDIS